MNGCATGQHLKEATITRRKAGKGQQEFLDHQDERRDHHCRDVRQQRRRRSGDGDAWRLRRSISNTGRRRPTGRWKPAFTSSTTSRPTRKRRLGTTRLSLETTARSASTKRSRSRSCCSRPSSGRPLPRSTAASSRVAPDHADALHFSGVLAHQQARSEQAVALIERSLQLEPDRADWYSNLGIVLQDRLELDDAIAAYEHAIALDPDHANAHNNLGVVLRAKGKFVEAEAAYRAAIRIRSRLLGCVQQPRRSAERPETATRSGSLLLQGHHAQAEASRSAKAAGARALHAR